MHYELIHFKHLILNSTFSLNNFLKTQSQICVVVLPRVGPIFSLYIWLIPVSAISVSVSVLVKMHGYRPKYRYISAKIPGIGQVSIKMKISVSVLVADVLVQIYIGIAKNNGCENISVSVLVGPISVQL
jgi:hypothetical protein